MSEIYYGDIIIEVTKYENFVTEYSTLKDIQDYENYYSKRILKISFKLKTSSIVSDIVSFYNNDHRHTVQYFINGEESGLREIKGKISEVLNNSSYVWQKIYAKNIVFWSSLFFMYAYLSSLKFSSSILENLEISNIFLTMGISLSYVCMLCVSYYFLVYKLFSEKAVFLIGKERDRFQILDNKRTTMFSAFCGIILTTLLQFLFV